jgi:hypothetical protein
MFLIHFGPQHDEPVYLYSLATLNRRAPAGMSRIDPIRKMPPAVDA